MVASTTQQTTGSTHPSQGNPAEEGRVISHDAANGRDRKGKARTDERKTPACPFSKGKRIPARAHNGVRVERFQVWQDVSSHSAGDTAQLNATITFEMSNEWYASLTRPDGTIRIERKTNGEVAEGNLILHEVHSGLEHTRPGHKRLQFIVSPPITFSRLEADEPVCGIVRMKFWNRRVTIKLPDTAVTVKRQEV